jgi:hypothetical protein
MKSKLVVILLLLLAANILLAQQTEISVHLYGGISVPNGDFAKSIDDFTGITMRSGLEIGDKIGLAKPGLGLGGELNTPVWFDGFFWTFSVGLFGNNVNGKDVQKEFRSQWGDTVKVSLDFGTWWNIPVLTGFRYDLNIARKMIVYGVGQIGVNLSKPPSLKATDGDLVIEETNYLLGRDWAYQLGIGFVYNQTYNLSIRYLNLGTSRYNGTKNLSELAFPAIFSRKINIIGEERSVSMFIITLGIQLFP